MRIEDRFVIAAPRERVWVAIKDPAIVAPCIPGCHGVEVVSPVLYKAKIRVQLGPIKAEFSVDVEIVSETPLEEDSFKDAGRGRQQGSSLSAENVLRLTALNERETKSLIPRRRSWWDAGKFGLGIMKKKAESLGRDFANAFKVRVEQPPAG